MMSQAIPSDQNDVSFFWCICWMVCTVELVRGGGVDVGDDVDVDVEWFDEALMLALDASDMDMVMVGNFVVRDNWVGALLALLDDAVGFGVGAAVGEEEGKYVGAFEGRFVGNSVGIFVGELVGNLVGESVGGSVGDNVGKLVGDTDGWFVGALVGEGVGILVGFKVGVFVGKSVGD